MTTELDSYTIKDFESLYGINRSNIYNRLNGLRDKGYPTEAEKQGTRSIYNANQKRLMDGLDAHIKSGNDIATFPGAEGQAELSYVLQDNSQPSYKTQDSLPDVTPAALGMASLIDSIVSRLSEVYPQNTDPLANLRSLQEVCDRGWLLSTSQLTPLLGRKSLPSKDFDRFGFHFARAGKNGAEAAWKVTQ